MTTYVALLRAVNVGGRQLKMDELKRIAGELGLENPRTFIASGNLLFASGKGKGALKRELEAAIEAGEIEARLESSEYVEFVGKNRERFGI